MKKKLYELNGEIHPLTTWAKMFNLPYHVLKYRIDNHWNLYEALNTPEGYRKEVKKERDIKLCIREICEKCRYYGGSQNGGRVSCDYITFPPYHRRPCYAGECLEKGVFELMKGKRMPKNTDGLFIKKKVG